MPYQRNSDVLPYLVGNRVYNGYSNAPNVGPVADKTGYRERDLKHKARRNAILRRLKAKNKGNYASPDSIREI
jgi:hypothetical protein